MGKVAVSFEAEGFDSGDTPETIYADLNEEITVPGNTGGLIKYEHAFTSWKGKGNGTVYFPDETLNVGTEGITFVAVFEEMDVPDEKKDDIIEKLNELSSEERERLPTDNDNGQVDEEVMDYLFTYYNDRYLIAAEGDEETDNSFSWTLAEEFIEDQNETLVWKLPDIYLLEGMYTELKGSNNNKGLNDKRYWSSTTVDNLVRVIDFKDGSWYNSEKENKRYAIRLYTEVILD